MNARGIEAEWPRRALRLGSREPGAEHAYLIEFDKPIERLPNGQPSDMVNRTRARDAAISLGRALSQSQVENTKLTAAA
jgi:hypothetical protein